MGAVGLFFVVTMVDWADMWAETFWTGRTSERMLYSMRVRIFAHLQRLGMDFYDHEMTGRILTRMTSDVDTLSQLLQSGLVNALVYVVQFVGVIVILSTRNVHLILLVLTVVPPLAIATVWFRLQSTPRLRPPARPHLGGQRRPPGEHLGGPGHPGLPARDATTRATSSG